MARKKNISKEIIIKTTLTILEEKGSLRDLSFREISRELGCAHTNLYNYYRTCDELLWDCLIEALAEMQGYTEKRISGLEGKEHFREAFLSMIDFAREHPAIYAFIWLEKLKGTPPVQVQAASQQVSLRFQQLLGSAEAAEMAHSYLHGELTKIVCGRLSPDESLRRNDQILAGVEKILTLYPPTGGKTYEE